MPVTRVCAAEVAASNIPSGANAASGWVWSENRRLTRSPSGSDGPAGSVAMTRIAVEPSAKRNREQAHVSAPPKLAPNPRKRSRRACPVDDRVLARRMISLAAGCFVSNWRAVHALVLPAPKIAAPTAFVHKIRDPSALHSQAGVALVAWSKSWAASRGSRDWANSHSTIDIRQNSSP